MPDASQKAEAQASGPPPAAIAEITDEELPSWKRFAAIPTAGQASSTPAPSVQNLSAPDSSNAAEHQQQSLPVGPLTTQLPRAPALQNSADAEPDLSKSIHEAIKESVRPAYNQLVESGVIETWHDVKASLGLGKNQWSDRDSAEGAAKTPSQWNSSGDASPYPVQPPRTAAQAQMDRELAAMMREKLIDQVTPWLIGLVVLYIVGYLIKLVVHYFRWKSAQRIARAQRQALRRTRTGGSTRIDRTRSPSSSPSESKETV
ncbi:hypothetical protein [Rhodoferax sp.]|uniref:hypothetical protein n=1 Tax=Rhodoferax sp. TaxID=50421 RepID=UPI00284E8B93|nr:hypothetical protein [Rhodoferax sp.]MDR3372015.1 hypothetical protein [Rhodoferax sp.]